MARVTVRVELGRYVLTGREVEWLEVTQAVGDHARCVLGFDRDPAAGASAVASALRVGELAGAAVRVVLVAEGGAGAGGAVEHLAFAGRVRAAAVDHEARGAGAVTVTALSDSYALAEHADRRYLREHTPAAVAELLGAGVAGSLPAAEARDYVQAGVSDWAFLAQVAGGEGLQLRAVWPRTPDGSSDHPAEVGRGFADEAHALTWGRELLRFATALSPVNAGVTGAFYDPGAKHDHRFRGVRADVAWLGGARPVVAAAREAATADAGGGDPGHLEPGRAAGARARTLAEFRGRLELASARRLGSAVRARGVSVHPALRAGDRLDVRPAAGFEADAGPAGGPASEQQAEHLGLFGLVRVRHRWHGGLYENDFEATPWADYHVAPEEAAAADGANAVGPAAGAPAFALGVVVEVGDPSGRGRVRVRLAWMGEAEHTAWVRVAGLGGGKGRGVGVLPSVGDEVVVAAVDGDPEHLVVLGGLWNGVDAAGHAPGRQHWVTPAGNTLAFVEGKAGEDREVVELYTREGRAWVQLAQRGPTGVPTVTVHAEGDISLEAPNGELRLTAKRMTTHVETDALRAVGGQAVDRIGGAVTVAAGGRLALKAGEVAVASAGALHAHAAGTHIRTGAQVTLNPPGARPPQVAAAAPPKGPSAWGPRPVPGPGPGRSTEDPRTPTTKDLAARLERPPVWVELEYRHPDDDTPMAGAPYRARFADGSVREGRLGADGTARLDGLPPALAGTAVEVTFGEVPDDYRPAAAPDAGGPNPHFRGAQADVSVFDGRPLRLASAAPDAGLAAAAAWAGHFRGAAADALEWLWGVLLGDFAENPSTGQIITGAVVTMIPVVDQIADVRDVFANVRHLFDDRRRADPWTWVALAITLVGIVPVFGSAAKGALRLVVKGVREGGSTTRRAVFAVIRKLGHGDPERFVARHLNAAAMRGAARAQLARVLGMLRGFFGAAARSRWAPESVRAAARRALERLEVVEREAPARLDEAVAVLDRGVQRALREGDSDLAARGTTNGRVRAEAETADPPGPHAADEGARRSGSAAGHGAVVDDGKIGYLFGRASGRAHNVERAAENLSHMRRLGATESEIASYLRTVGGRSDNVARTYTNEYGTFEVRESLFAGRTGQFAKFESTWHIMPDGTRRMTTVIPFGGR